MVYADHIKDTHEVSMLSKMAIGLGFQTETVPSVVERALKLVSKKVDYEVFKKEMNAGF